MKNYQKYLLSMVIDVAFDQIAKALKRQARKTDNTVDDDMVHTFRKNRAEILGDIKSRL